MRKNLLQQLPLDSSRQGLAGFSEGGNEAYQLAPKNNWVTSVETVEGYMTGGEKKLARPLSELNIRSKLRRIFGGSRFLRSA